MSLNPNFVIQGLLTVFTSFFYKNAFHFSMLSGFLNFFLISGDLAPGFNYYYYLVANGFIKHRITIVSHNPNEQFNWNRVLKLFAMSLHISLH